MIHSDIAKIQSFTAIAEPIMNIIEIATRENKKLTELRDTLLPRLMSGELDISDVEI